MKNIRQVMTERLCVKELAVALQVSTQFVYQMRACGFVMRGKHFNERATLAQAIAWIQANDFRLLKGYGVTKSQ